MNLLFTFQSDLFIRYSGVKLLFLEKEDKQYFLILSLDRSFKSTIKEYVIFESVQQFFHLTNE